ncbi:MAG: hypothetical protein HZY75_11990 [Nocardioidaceae bacterium]|nr:MAG: hypothetical protein HZY75_11990 [Nocardioidaceae bacterium]
MSDLDELAVLVRHRPGCQAPVIRPTTGKRGDQGVRCAVCGAVAFPGWNPAANAEFQVTDPEDARRLALLAREMRHAGHCSGPAVRWLRGRRGNLGVMCRACGAFDYLPLSEAERLATQPRVVPAPVIAVETGPHVDCVRCGTPVPTRPGKAVVPLCPGCRPKAKGGRRRG